MEPTGEPAGLMGRKPFAALSSAKSVLEIAGAFAVLAIPLFGLRVFLAADFNPGVASALAANSSPISLSVSIAISLVPFLSLALGIGLALVAGWQGQGLGRKRFTRGLPLFALSLVAYIPALLTQEWFAAGLMLVPLIAAVGVGVTRDLSAPDASIVRWSPVWISASAIVTILVAPMWLPPERVVLAGVPTTVYVLSVDGDDAVLFLASRNSVMRVPSDGLVDRQYCTPERKLETIADGIFGEPDGLPVCP